MPNSNSRTLTANFTADTSGFSPKINALIQNLKTLNQDFEQNKSKIAELNTKLKEYQKELSTLNSKTNGGTNATREQSQRMQELRDSIARCNTEIGTYKAAQTNLRSQINSVNHELTEQQQAFNGTGQAAATFGEILKANIASDVIMNGIRRIVDGLRQAAAFCYDVGSKFEAGMSQVAAVSGASAEELERLTAKAKELGATTKFTASETAKAMNYMAMAGWKTEQMLNGIDGILNLAAASGTDLATTSDIVTDALTAFGMKAEDCAHFADVLAAASSNANTNVSMMGETFRYCAPIAGALGFKAEDVATGIGLMANAGVKATNAGTAMRKFMTELSEGLTITGKKIGEVTIQTSNADGTMRSYAEILNELRSVFSQLTDAEKSSAAKDIVGQNALSGFLAMMNASENDVQKLTYAIQNCDGAAADMAVTMQDNVSGAVTKFHSALEGAGIAVYDKFKGALADTISIFSDAMSGLRDEIDSGELGESIEQLADKFREFAAQVAEFAKNNISGLVDGLTKVLDFIITFRKEIGAAVSGFILPSSANAAYNVEQKFRTSRRRTQTGWRPSRTTTKMCGIYADRICGICTRGEYIAFKASMAIGSTVISLVSAFKNLGSVIGAVTAGQAGLNAVMAANPIGAVAAVIGVLVGGLVELDGYLTTVTAKGDELREQADELAQSMDECREKSNGLKDIKTRYDEIYSSETPAAEKSEELKNLQDELIQQMPELVDKIDLVSGAYENVVSMLVCAATTTPPRQERIRRTASADLIRLARGQTLMRSGAATR